MEAGDRDALKRLKEALACVNRGESGLVPISCPPSEVEEHIIAYGRRNYAKVTISPAGVVSVEPLADVGIEQLELVLSICETLLSDSSCAVGG